MSTPNPSTPTVDPALAERLARLEAFEKSERARKAKADEAKEARKRANNRPTDANGKEMAASQAFFTIAHEWVTRTVAANTSKDGKRNDAHIVDQVINALDASLSTLAVTPSMFMGTTQDNERRALLGRMPADGQ